MKIKILTKIPVQPHDCPLVGGIYDVTGTDQNHKGGKIYFIEVNGARVGIFARECEVVNNEEAQK